MTISFRLNKCILVILEHLNGDVTIDELIFRLRPPHPLPVYAAVIVILLGEGLIKVLSIRCELKFMGSVIPLNIL
jgi:hypothetical protein